MNDRLFLHPVGDDPQALARQTGKVGAQSVGGLVRKRFRRSAVQCMAGPQATARISRTACNLTTIPSDSALKTLTPMPQSVAENVRDQWSALRLEPPGVRRHFLFGAPLVNFFRRDPAARAFDMLRTRLLQTLRTNGWNRIAIASPTHQCGATFTAVNLAQSLARVRGSRTVLLDINHRTPGIAAALEMDCSSDMRAYLEDQVPLQRHLVRASATLALGLIGEPCAGGAEVLHNAQCARTLDRMTQVLRPDVVLCDLPPVLAHDDFTAFLPQVDAVLLVADGTQTSPGHIAACKRILDRQVPLLGVVLNRARTSGLQEYET